MATRGQIIILEEGPIPPDSKRDRVFTLYRHHDGTPKNIISDIKEAYRKFKGYELVKKFNAYSTGERAPCIASLICSVFPQAYQPMKKDIIWGATAYVYCLYAFSDGQNMPVWENRLNMIPI